MTDSAPRMIDSILHLEDQAAWEKVVDTHELAQLHRRFWGSHDKPLELNADEDEGDNEGDDEDAPEVGDNGPECPFLEFGIPAFPRPTLLVRRECIQMYKRRVDHLKPCDRGPKKFKSPSLVATGQPGIGRLFILLYRSRWNILAEREEDLYHESLDETGNFRNVSSFTSTFVV